MNEPTTNDNSGWGGQDWGTPPDTLPLEQGGGLVVPGTQPVQPPSGGDTTGGDTSGNNPPGTEPVTPPPAVDDPFSTLASAFSAMLAGQSAGGTAPTVLPPVTSEGGGTNWGMIGGLAAVALLGWAVFTWWKSRHKGKK